MGDQAHTLWQVIFVPPEDWHGGPRVRLYGVCVDENTDDEGRDYVEIERPDD